MAGGYSELHLKDGSVLPVSRQRVGELKQLLSGKFQC